MVAQPQDLVVVIQTKAEILYELYLETKDIRYLGHANASYSFGGQIIDSLYQFYELETDKLLFTEVVHEFYQKAIHTLLLSKEHYKVSYIDSVFDLIEKSKSNVLRRKVIEAKALVFGEIPASLIEREKELTIKITNYQKRLKNCRIIDKCLDMNPQESPRKLTMAIQKINGTVQT